MFWNAFQALACTKTKKNVSSWVFGSHPGGELPPDPLVGWRASTLPRPPHTAPVAAESWRLRHSKSTSSACELIGEGWGVEHLLNFQPPPPPCVLHLQPSRGSIKPPGPGFWPQVVFLQQKYMKITWKFKKFSQTPSQWEGDTPHHTPSLVVSGHSTPCSFRSTRRAPSIFSASRRLSRLIGAATDRTVGDESPATATYWPPTVHLDAATTWASRPSVRPSVPRCQSSAPARCAITTWVVTSYSALSSRQLTSLFHQKYGRLKIQDLENDGRNRRAGKCRTK